MKLEPKKLNLILLAFGTARARRLISHFGSAAKAWDASKYSLIKLGIKNEAADEIIKRKEALDEDKEWDRLAEAGVDIVTLGTKDYPEKLSHTYSPPLALYTRGARSLLNVPSLAVVGTRTHSSYARTTTVSIVSELAGSGINIVSGLAQGIDAIAHLAALEAGGKTTAVLGNGLDDVFPGSSRPLAQKILDSGGLIVSEYPFGTPPLKQHFPARNRIVAGLALGVLVIESREAGGSLITARHALEANRDIFAVPGPINMSTSAGPNKLIQSGAKLVTCGADILEELSLPIRKHLLKDVAESMSAPEKIIVDILEIEALHIDTIIKKVKLTPQEVNSYITTLELKGIVKDVGGGIWSRQI